MSHLLGRLPVVGVLSEGICDLVRDEHTGYLLDASGLDEEEQVMLYRARLEHLMYNYGLRIVMGQAGLVDARQRSWYEAMNKLLDGYEEAIVGARPLVAA